MLALEAMQVNPVKLRCPLFPYLGKYNEFMLLFIPDLDLEMIIKYLNR